MYNIWIRCVKVLRVKKGKRKTHPKKSGVFNLFVQIFKLTIYYLQFRGF